MTPFRIRIKGLTLARLILFDMFASELEKGCHSMYLYHKGGSHPPEKKYQLGGAMRHAKMLLWPTDRSFVHAKITTQSCILFTNHHPLIQWLSKTLLHNYVILRSEGPIRFGPLVPKASFVTFSCVVVSRLEQLFPEFSR